jgi:hypothetical protein
MLAHNENARNPGTFWICHESDRVEGCHQGNDLRCPRGLLGDQDRVASQIDRSSIAEPFPAPYGPLHQRGEIPRAREQRKLAAILAAYDVGYSRLMGRDESGTLVCMQQPQISLFAR